MKLSDTARGAIMLFTMISIKFGVALIVFVLIGDYFSKEVTVFIAFIAIILVGGLAITIAEKTGFID